MAPPSAFPSAVQTNMPQRNMSSPSTRNASFMSLVSSQGSAFPATQTPNHVGYGLGFDRSYNDEASPQNSWTNFGSASMAALSPDLRMDAFDWLEAHDHTSDGFHTDLFENVTEALAGQA